jgi:glutamine amidotransferase
MTSPSIAVIDYDIGNVASMVNALVTVGAAVVLTRDLARIKEADALILPGVGSFPQGMENLRKYNLPDAIVGHINRGKPFLGVCLGMQLLLDGSEEFGLYGGLAIIKGMVRKLSMKPFTQDKLPHIGWNTILQPRPERWNNTIFSHVPEASDLYFVHSFSSSPENQEVILSITNFGGHQFCSALQSGSVFGCQFHPEKSGAVGLSMLKSFVALTGI